MSKLDVIVSVWQPWYLAMLNRISIKDQVTAALALGVQSIAIKGTNRNRVYGAKENLIYPGNQYSNDHLEVEAKKRELEVDLWCYLSLKHPATEARAIKQANARWNPRNVFLDAQGHAKPHAQNTGAFLRSLGQLHRHDGTPVKVWLQSYRRPDKHPEIAWYKWLTYIADGLYVIDGISPQAYYVGSQDSVADYKRMLSAYGYLEIGVKRDLDWHVTLPTYREHGWQPTADSLEAGIDFLRNNLGDRLIGVNFFRLGWLMDSRLTDVWTMLLAYDWGDEEPEPEPEPTPFEQRPEPERWGVVGDDLRHRGVV